MTDRNLKAQVGARVPPELLERAKTAASALGMSFNSWVEQAFNLKLGPVHEHAVQTSMLEQEQQAEARQLVHVETFVRRVPDAPIRFASNCSNGTYHWRHSPDNPCPRCGGGL